MLEKLGIENKRIFDVSTISDSIVELRDGCDGYFFVHLTKAELIELISDLQKIANDLTAPDGIRAE